MRLFLLSSAAALALLSPARAAENIECELTDLKGNSLLYVFAVHDDRTGLDEALFERNGTGVSNYHGGGIPQWTASHSPTAVTLASVNDPGWSIQIDTNSPNHSRIQPAALFHNRMIASGTCEVGGSRTPAPPPVYRAQAPAPLPPMTGEDSIGIISNGRSAMASITLGSQALMMTIDTGASDLQVPDDVADQLVASGDADDTHQTARFTLADNRQVDSRIIIIHRVQIGRHVLTNIRASTGPAGHEGLIPFSVLNQAGRFTIDSAANKLIFG